MSQVTIKSFLICACLWVAAPLFGNLELPSAPHEATPQLKPYATPPAPVQLTPKEMAKVKSGTPVYKPRSEGGITEGTASFLVKAPIEIVWKTLVNFKMYPKWIGSSCKETLVYHEDANHIQVGFKIYHWAAGNWIYFIDHTINSNEYWMTWTLHRKYKSDIDDVRGAWVLTRNPDNINETVVYYYNAVIPGGALNLIKNLLTSQGLKTAITWVIAQAKLEHEAVAQTAGDAKDDQKIAKVAAAVETALIKTGEPSADAVAAPKNEPAGTDAAQAPGGDAAPLKKADTASEPDAKPATKPAAKSTTKPATKPAIKPAAKPASKDQEITQDHKNKE